MNVDVERLRVIMVRAFWEYRDMAGLERESHWRAYCSAREAYLLAAADEAGERFVPIWVT